MSKTQGALNYIIELFNKNNIFYVVGGHAGLILQGVKLKDDNEIDICTSKEGAYTIQQLLNSACIDAISYKELDWFKSHWGLFKVKGVKIEVMGDPKRKLKDGSWRGLPKKNITSVVFNGKEVNVFTLKSEWAYYESTSYNKPKHKQVANKIKQAISGFNID